MKELKLYIDSIEKLKILKRKIPKVKWFVGEDILHWQPCFPFVVYIDSRQQMTFNRIVSLKEKRDIIAATNKFFNLSLEIE